MQPVNHSGLSTFIALYHCHWLHCRKKTGSFVVNGLKGSAQLSDVACRRWKLIERVWGGPRVSRPMKEWYWNVRKNDWGNMPVFFCRCDILHQQLVVDFWAVILLICEFHQVFVPVVCCHHYDDVCAASRRYDTLESFLSKVAVESDFQKESSTCVMNTFAFFLLSK